ncbi:hypothetical protein BYT27DRAFT_7300783, partial [Phlegmacium glaucopus]
FSPVEVGGEKIKVERRQVAIVPGYTFTNYKLQGQTLEYIIMDLTKPPAITIQCICHTFKK